MYVLNAEKIQREEFSCEQYRNAADYIDKILDAPLTQMLLERNPVLFYLIDQTSIWSIAYRLESTALLSAY